jgi:hypothetical protein
VIWFGHHQLAAGGLGKPGFDRQLAQIRGVEWYEMRLKFVRHEFLGVSAGF